MHDSGFSEAEIEQRKYIIYSWLYIDSNWPSTNQCLENIIDGIAELINGMTQLNIRFADAQRKVIDICLR